MPTSTSTRSQTKCANKGTRNDDDFSVASNSSTVKASNRPSLKQRINAAINDLPDPVKALDKTHNGLAAAMIEWTMKQENDEKMNTEKTYPLIFSLAILFGGDKDSMSDQARRELSEFSMTLIGDNGFPKVDALRALSESDQESILWAVFGTHHGRTKVGRRLVFIPCAVGSKCSASSPKSNMSLSHDSNSLRADLAVKAAEEKGKAVASSLEGLNALKDDMLREKNGEIDRMLFIQKATVLAAFGTVLAALATANAAIARK